MMRGRCRLFAQNATVKTRRAFPVQLAAEALKRELRPRVLAVPMKLAILSTAVTLMINGLISVSMCWAATSDTFPQTTARSGHIAVTSAQAEPNSMGAPKSGRPNTKKPPAGARDIRAPIQECPPHSGGPNTKRPPAGARATGTPAEECPPR